MILKTLSQTEQDKINKENWKKGKYLFCAGVDVEKEINKSAFLVAFEKGLIKVKQPQKTQQERQEINNLNRLKQGFKITLGECA